MASDSPVYIKKIDDLFAKIKVLQDEISTLRTMAAYSEGDAEGLPFVTMPEDGDVMEEQSGEAQHLGVGLQELAETSGDSVGTLTEEEIDNLIEAAGFPTENAALWPFSYGIPYDLRRSTFELTTANGVWIPFVGITPVLADEVDWSTVTSIDFNVKDSEGVDRSYFFSAPALQESNRAIGLHREEADGTITVVAFETTGPVTFPGFTSTPFCNQNRSVLTGDVLPDTTTGVNGDCYIKLDTDNVFVRVNDLWLTRDFSMRIAGGTIHVVTAQPAGRGWRGGRCGDHRGHRAMVEEGRCHDLDGATRLQGPANRLARAHLCDLPDPAH